MPGQSPFWELPFGPQVEASADPQWKLALARDCNIALSVAEGETLVDHNADNRAHTHKPKLAIQVYSVYIDKSLDIYIYILLGLDELPPKSIMSRDSLWCQTPIRGGDSIFDKLDPYCIVKPGAPNDPASGTAPASERFGKVPNSSGSKGGTRRSFSFLPRLGEFKRFQTPVMWNVGVNPQFEHLSWQVDPLFRDFFFAFLFDCPVWGVLLDIGSRHFFRSGIRVS